MQRFTAAQVYNQREHLVDQEVADGLQTNVAARIAADYLAPGVVNDKVGDSGKRKYVATRYLAAAKPSPATWRPRTQVPSGIEADGLKTPAESRANCRPDRRHPNCRKLRKRNVRNDSQPVGLLTKAWDSRFAQISAGSRRPENFQLRPFTPAPVPALFPKCRRRLEILTRRIRAKQPRWKVRYSACLRNPKSNLPQSTTGG